MKEIANRRAVAFVGAGLSATVGLPTWRSLVEAQIESAIADFEPAMFSSSREHLRQVLQGKVTLTNVDLAQIVRVFQSGDLMMAAALLKRLRGGQFTSSLEESVPETTRPGFAHRAVARLNFSQVITTNYDGLLEAAYETPKIDAITYTQTDELMRRLVGDKFFILKLHGHLSDLNRAIVSDEDFRTVRRFQPLIQCLRLIALTKHLVFIGHSLRDPDLVGLLSDLRVEFPDSGPHYAIFDHDQDASAEFSPIYLDYLGNALGIRAIVCRYSGSCKATTNGPEHSPRTRSLVQHLTLLHGEVCELSSPKSHIVVPQSSGLKRHLEALLAHACQITGSFRGDLAFFDDRKYSGWSQTIRRAKQTSESIPAAGLYINCSYGPTSRTFTGEATAGSGARWHNLPDKAYPNSVIWTTFHYSRDEIVVDDWMGKEERPAAGLEPTTYPSAEYHKSKTPSKDHREETTTKPIGAAPDDDPIHPESLAYREGHTSVISELATPIYVGDNRVGVLNLESEIFAAYGDGHKRVARQLASEIGRVWAEVTRAEIHRDVTVNPNRMKLAGKGPRSVEAMDDVIKQLVPWPGDETNCALFIADHGDGRLLRLTGEKKPELPSHYMFGEKSFASMVFHRGRPLFVPNRENTPDWVQINNTNATRQRIGQELVGVPLFTRGFPIGVLTAWGAVLKTPNRTEDTYTVGADRSELIIRTAQLVARAYYLRQISQFQNQYKIIREKCEQFLSHAYELKFSGLGKRPHSEHLRTLVEEIRTFVDVPRVRLFWVVKAPIDLEPIKKLKSEDECRTLLAGRKFECLASIDRSEDGRLTEDKFCNRRNSADDNPFIRYFLRRTAWSASAMLLYPDLLDASSAPRATKGNTDGRHLDVAAKRFERDERVGWYLAPITRCEYFEPAESQERWSQETRRVYGYLSIDHTLRYPDGVEDKNDLPLSRTWHELARLKLTWSAATLGYLAGRFTSP